MFSSRKRKVFEEHRTFNMKWEQNFLFTDNNGKPQCLVCLQVLAVSKGYNVSRHYNSLHKAKYDQYTGELRVILVKELKSKIRKQKSSLTRLTADASVPATRASVPATSASVAASYEVCLELVKWRYSFKDGEIVKRCAVRMARACGDEEMARTFENVSLSHETVARRVSEMSEHVFSKLKSIVHRCKYFSLALDDSTEVNGIKQLLIFIRTIDEDFSVHEELLEMHPLGSGTEGADILTAIVRPFSEFGGLHRCSCIVTNGSEAMMGSNTGLVRLLTKNKVDCVIFHCIVHEEVLLGKCRKMSDAMGSVVGIINILRTSSIIHRHKKFIPFLEIVNAELCELPLHSNVRWVSEGKCLQHFFSLRKDILYFFQNENTGITCQYQEQLQDDQFLRSLAFLTDLTLYLNTLNLNLQCKQQNVSQLVQHIEAFRKKLKLFSACLKKNDITDFSSCRELLTEDSSADFSSFVEITDNISAEFDKRFANFDSLKQSLELFNSPMESAIEQQPPDLQLELCELQVNFFFQTKKELHDSFWKLVSRERFPNLRDFGLKMCSMFGGTYVCENTFSLMKYMKSKTSNRIEKHTIDTCLRLATTSIPVNIEALVQVQQPLAKCSHKQDEREPVMDASSMTPGEDEGRGWLDYDPAPKGMVFVKDEQPDPDVVVKEEYSEDY